MDQHQQRDQQQGTPQGIDLQEVLTEMDDRTRVGWDAALARVTIRHQARRIAELENDQAPTAQPPVPPVEIPAVGRADTHGG